MPVWILRLLGKLLYLWTRTQVVRTPPAEYQLNAKSAVCYVLQHRHLSNLLVLDRESRLLGLPSALTRVGKRNLSAHNAYFFLRSASWATPGTDREADRPPFLRELVGEAIADPQFDVQLIPVTILWGRAPDTQDSILKALFAETWQPTSSLRQLFAIFIHGRQTTVSFAAPVSLRKLVQNDRTSARPLKRTGRLLAMHFQRERELAIGPDLSHRQTQLNALLGATSVREAIASEAIAKSIPFAKAEATARRYALEIASDYSYTIMQALMLALDWVSTRVFNGVEIHHFERLNRIAPGSSLIYTPCHRSYLDGALLSHFLYRRGITAPHATAGANLNIPVVGHILRGVGSFFVRRKFKGNALYSVIFNQYVHRVIEQGFPLQYYIEGGRSRSGTLLQPKAGMLGMTVRSYLNSRQRPLYFVPVYFGYERLMEGGSYLEELGGKRKQGESLGGALRALRLFRENFGKVQVNIGEPLLLSQYLDRQQPDWRERLPADPQAPWLRQAVNETGHEIARRINAAAVVAPVNLLALALLATPKHTADVRDIHRQIEHLQYFAQCGLLPESAVVTNETPADIVEHVAGLNLLTIVPHPLGDLLKATPPQSSLLAYPRNNVLHLFALPALIACLVSHNLILSRKRIQEAITGIYPLLQAAIFLSWHADELPTLIDETLVALEHRKLIEVDEVNDFLRAPPPMSDTHVDLRQLGEVIRLTIERQFLILALLQHHGSAAIHRDALEEAAHQLAQRLSLLYENNAPEFSEKTQFATVIDSLMDRQLLTSDSTGLIHFDERISTPAKHTELLLDAEIRHSVERMAHGNMPPSAPSDSD